VHLGALPLHRRLAQLLERRLAMPERGEQIHQPQPVAALPVDRGKAGVGLLEARFGLGRERRPGSEGDGASVGEEDAELAEHDRRQHHPFEIGQKHVAIGRGIHHQPHRLAEGGVDRDGDVRRRGR
jgi:hypothetical protein